MAPAKFSCVEMMTQISSDFGMYLRAPVGGLYDPKLDTIDHKLKVCSMNFVSPGI